MHFDRIEDFVTEFGGLVSTSNEILEDQAVVVSEKPVLWTIEIREIDGNVVSKHEGPPIQRHKKIDLP